MSIVNLKPYHPLRDLRQAAGLSQEDLASMADLAAGQPAVSHIESGRPLYRGAAALACAGVLGVDLVDVLGPAQRQLHAKVAEAGLDDLWLGTDAERRIELRELLHAEGVTR